jgi:hypothetical protein
MRACPWSSRDALWTALPSGPIRSGPHGRRARAHRDQATLPTLSAAPRRNETKRYSHVYFDSANLFVFRLFASHVRTTISPSAPAESVILCVALAGRLRTCVPARSVPFHAVTRNCVLISVRLPSVSRSLSPFTNVPPITSTCDSFCAADSVYLRCKLAYPATRLRRCEVNGHVLCTTLRSLVLETSVCFLQLATR